MANHFRAACVIGSALLGTTVAAQPRWSVEPTPSLDIKGLTVTGAVAFGSATWATRLADGTVIVADGSGPALRIFDSKGTLVRAVGRAGQGPGDFRSLTWVGRCAGDSVVAWDFVQSRLTIFDATFTPARVTPIPPNGGGQLVTSCNAAGVFAFAGRGRRIPPLAPPDPAAGYFIARIAAPLQLVDATGKVLATTGELPWTEVIGGMGGRGGGMPRPLGQATTFAIVGSRLFVGSGDSASIDSYALTGERTATLAVRVPARTPTRAQYERATERFLSLMPGPMREQARTWALGIPMPATLPAYTGLLADPTGLLWVLLSVPGDTDTRLRALRADGQVAADLIIPDSVAVFEIGTDYVLAAREDSDGEQHIVLYRLRR